MKKSAFDSPRHLSLIAAAIFALSVAACTTKAADSAGGAAAGLTNTGADSAALAQLAKTYEDAYNRKDVAAVAALHTDDAVQLLENGKLLRGRAAIQAAMVADTANWPKLTITPNEPATYVGDVAWGSGTTVAQVPGPGGAAMSIPGSYIVVLRRDAGTWKLAALAGGSDSAAVAAMMPPAAGSKAGKAK